MNIVLLSGGSGRRLWPLSNDVQSKQFLKLLQNEHGGYESMAERVASQLSLAVPDAKIYVSCTAAQKDILRNQLGPVEAIYEPESRDTFPAVSLAAAYLHYKKSIDEDEVFLVCSIDIFADSLYFEKLAEIAKPVAAGEYKIGLIGAIPTIPTEKYGYILHDGGKVTGFAEKPHTDMAEKLISKGALWNTGVFAVKIGYVLSHAKRYAQFGSFESLTDQYAKLPRISFDYEVVEKEASAGVTVYDGIWKDLGTWNTLTEEMSGHTSGSNILISESCENTHVLNMQEIPVIVNDIQDAVVVVNHDGILITSKPGSAHLKPLVEKIYGK